MQPLATQILFPSCCVRIHGDCLSEESHEYHVRVDWTHGRVGNLVIEGKQTIEVASPPEFDGPEGIITPEDMFVAAATSCFMTTFVTFSKKMRFDYKSFTCDGYGTLEKVEKGFQFTKLVLKTKVSVESEDIKSKAERALELAGKYCLVSNSMKCPTEHENEVIVE
ncbi:MAG: OsmC family peroxiredoxin [Candidatus Lokiarchaeota archaeon]|nr:OsmC family peroxiredoxin [Candidatus Lokiarchaeota archaeon]